MSSERIVTSRACGLRNQDTIMPPPPPPALLPGAIGAPPADIIVSVIWRSITRVNVVDQTFDAEVDIKVGGGSVHALCGRGKSKCLILSIVSQAYR